MKFPFLFFCFFFGKLIAATPSELEVQFIPQISLMTPSEFTLTSGNLEVYYASENLGQPFFHLGWQKWFKQLGRLTFYGTARIGYTYRQGLHQVLLMDSNRSDSDSVRLHWLPASLGIVTEYSISEMPFLRPYFSLNSGFHFLNQTSSLEGGKAYALPFLSTGFGISFINLDRGDGDTILGFSFGGSYQNTMLVQEKCRGWSLDFGFKLRL